MIEKAIDLIGLPPRITLIFFLLTAVISGWISWALLNVEKRKQIKYLFRNRLFYLTVIISIIIAFLVPIKEKANNNEVTSTPKIDLQDQIDIKNTYNKSNNDIKNNSEIINKIKTNDDNFKISNNQNKLIRILSDTLQKQNYTLKCSLTNKKYTVNFKYLIEKFQDHWFMSLERSINGKLALLFAVKLNKNFISNTIINSVSIRETDQGWHIDSHDEILFEDIGIETRIALIVPESLINQLQIEQGLIYGESINPNILHSLLRKNDVIMDSLSWKWIY